MLKLLLSHWQAHREPLPFVLTDDPLYCSHLTKSPFPEVYSVNRVNPIFEEDETQLEGKSQSSSYRLKRSISEETERRATSSDDTGYSSSGQFKSLTTTTADSLTDDVGSLEESRRMSSDSDDCSQPEAVTVSADVHRVSYPEDVIVLSSNSSSDGSRRDFSANSYYGGSSDSSSQEPFDSLTMSSLTDTSGHQKVGSSEAKRPTSAVKEKLQKLLDRGNSDRLQETFLDSLDAKPPGPSSKDFEIEKTKNDLMKSLTRALSSKVPKREESSLSNGDILMVTRSDSTFGDSHMPSKSSDRNSNSSVTSPKIPYSSKSSSSAKDTNGVTRQDESSGSSLSSFAKPKKHQHRGNKPHLEKESRKGKSENTTESSDSQNTHSTHKCKLCENVNRPLAFHQLLPGHWSYDNVYLPQIPGMCCSCMHHHHNPFPPSSDDDIFYPLYYHHDLARARHSWAPYTNSKNLLEGYPKRQKSADDKKLSSSSKENSGSGNRCSPDGSSRETDTSQTDPSHLKKSSSERRSLREPKKCKCEHCLSSVLDKNSSPHFTGHDCTCYCMSHRRVKFASDTDLSQHRHMHSDFRHGKDGNNLGNGDSINAAAFVMNLPHLNGHAMNKKLGTKENGLKSKKAPPLIPRGLKEPVKMDELYGSYPINFRDWEAHYRLTYLKKRRKRALNMVGMAIGIILVVGIAIALTFVFLRIRRPV